MSTTCVDDIEWSMAGGCTTASGLEDGGGGVVALKF